MIDLVVDKKFRDLLPEQSEGERKSLEELLLSEGCRDALVVWNHGGKLVLLDGHNRYDICRKHSISFETRELEFSSADEAADWIDRTQASRRNCTPEQYRIITGRIYNRRKKSHGGDRKSSGKIDHLKDSAAESVASEMGVSEKTVRLNAERAEVHDALVKAGNKDAAKAVAKAPQKVVSQAAKVIKDESKPKKERVKEAAIIATTKPAPPKSAPAKEDPAEHRRHTKALLIKHIEAALRVAGDLNVIAPNIDLRDRLRMKIDEAYRLAKSWKV